jgi:hypothetical protein
MNIHFTAFMVLLSLGHGKEISIPSSSTFPIAEGQSMDFVPDESVSGMFFEDPASVQNKLGDLMPLLDRDAPLPFIYIFSHDSKQYLKLVFHPGASGNAFSEFEVGYGASNKKPNKASSIRTFETESGITLGMSRESVIKKKGLDFKEVRKGEIRYTIDDKEKSLFLKRYNMPVYFCQYKFDGRGILMEYNFGFEYP